MKMLALGLNLSRKLGDVQIPADVCDDTALMRPFRLLKTYAASLMRRLFHDAGSRTAIASQSVEEPLTGGLID